MACYNHPNGDPENSCDLCYANEQLCSLHTERKELASKLESVYSLLRQGVARFSTGEKLMPCPEAPQDLAFLFHVIDGESGALEGAKRELERLIPIAARAESAELQVNENASEVMRLQGELSDARLQLSEARAEIERLKGVRS